MIIALRLDTPTPLRMYLQNALLSLRLQVTLCKTDSNFLFRVSMPPHVLEKRAEATGVEKEIIQDATRTKSEDIFPFREFTVAGRDAHASKGALISFTPAEHAGLLQDMLDHELLVTDDRPGPKWVAALVASGRTDAVDPKREWLF